MIVVLDNELPLPVLEQVQCLGLTITSRQPAGSHALCWQHDALTLLPPDGQGAVSVDFVAGGMAHRLRFGGGRGQPVARAVGIKGDSVPRVLDATAGLGRDAFVLASLGCTMTLLERSPIAWLLLTDGLRRAVADPATAAVAARIQLQHVHALDWLREAEPAQFDVVYLDPMFPEPDKRAKSKKEMAVLQALLGGDTDADALLEPALQVATKRVVVKRPRHAPWLAERKPDFVYEGESTRFDVYRPVAAQQAPA